VQTEQVAAAGIAGRKRRKAIILDKREKTLI
jgi:hypothetical protein